jgi:hypothetical protein
MDIAIKLITALMPLLLEIIKYHHPDKSRDDQKQIAQDMFNSELKNDV